MTITTSNKPSLFRTFKHIQQHQAVSSRLNGYSKQPVRPILMKICYQYGFLTYLDHRCKFSRLGLMSQTSFNALIAVPRFLLAFDREGTEVSPSRLRTLTIIYTRSLQF